MVFSKTYSQMNKTLFVDQLNAYLTLRTTISYEWSFVGLVQPLGQSLVKYVLDVGKPYGLMRPISSGFQPCQLDVERASGTLEDLKETVAAFYHAPELSESEEGAFLEIILNDLFEDGISLGLNYNP